MKKNEMLYTQQAAELSPSSEPVRKKKAHTFVYPEYEPCISGLNGMMYDFNCGARIYMPNNGHRMRCRILDKASDTLLYDEELKQGYCVNCAKKYYMNYRLELLDMDSGKKLWEHHFDMRDKDILVQMPTEGAVGDSIAWFSFVERFQKQYGGKVHVLMPDRIRELVEKQYPDIVFVSRDEAVKLKPYATYYLGLYFRDDVDWQPYDFRLISLAETAGWILGVDDLSEIPPRVAFGERTIEEPYVVIATQASSHAKHWCNPFGWRRLVERLKRRGYRVVCVDKDAEVGHGDIWHHIPHGCEDFTGPRPLQQRIDMIHHADFFIGLSSGLSWVAWMCDVPIVLISGICMPFGEFQTPYRVQPRHTCHGCWNDTRYEFDHSDFMWCPRNKDTPRAYECTKAISPDMVLRAVDRIPGVLPCIDTDAGEACDK